MQVAGRLLLRGTGRLQRGIDVRARLERVRATGARRAVLGQEVLARARKHGLYGRGIDPAFLLGGRAQAPHAAGEHEERGLERTRVEESIDPARHRLEGVDERRGRAARHARHVEIARTGRQVAR